MSGRLRAFLRTVLGRRPQPGSPTQRLSTLLAPGQLLKVVTANIHDGVAVVIVGDPLPPLTQMVEERLTEEAWRALREHPAEGAVRALEVWAPRTADGRPALALRRDFKGPLVVSPAPTPEAIRAHSHGRVPHVLTADEDAPRAEGPHPAGAERLQASHRPLKPLAEFLEVPTGLTERLRSRGIDLPRAELVPLVRALLEEAGYAVRGGTERDGAIDLEASSEAGRVLARCFHTERPVPARMVDRFGIAFQRSGADEGFFVTDGYLPFEARHWERDPRIHLLDRIGLQRFVEALAARNVGRPA
jgi:hypothetical protein